MLIIKNRLFSYVTHCILQLQYHCSLLNIMKIDYHQKKKNNKLSISHIDKTIARYSYL